MGANTLSVRGLLLPLGRMSVGLGQRLFGVVIVVGTDVGRSPRPHVGWPLRPLRGDVTGNTRCPPDVVV